MIWGIIAIALSLYLVINTERVRRRPGLFRTGFMIGHTRSLVLLWYFSGRREEVPEALATDTNLRRKYILECYLWSIFGFICGFGLLLTSI